MRKRRLGVSIVSRWCAASAALLPACTRSDATLASGLAILLAAFTWLIARELHARWRMYADDAVRYQQQAAAHLTRGERKRITAASLAKDDDVLEHWLAESRHDDEAADAALAGQHRCEAHIPRLVRARYLARARAAAGLAVLLALSGCGLASPNWWAAYGSAVALAASGKAAQQ